jgi:inorganic pyrophosphatase
MARGLFTSVSFLLGAFTSMASGYLGMKVAVYSNVRTTISAQKPGWTECFNTAFRAGAVMGKHLVWTQSSDLGVLGWYRKCES